MINLIIGLNISIKRSIQFLLGVVVSFATVLLVYLSFKFFGNTNKEILIQT
jgi:hypothetical protein